MPLHFSLRVAQLKLLYCGTRMVNEKKPGAEASYPVTLGRKEKSIVTASSLWVTFGGFYGFTLLRPYQLCLLTTSRF